MEAAIREGWGSGSKVFFHGEEEFCWSGYNKLLSCLHRFFILGDLYELAARSVFPIRLQRYEEKSKPHSKYSVPTTIIPPLYYGFCVNSSLSRMIFFCSVAVVYTTQSHTSYG